MSVLSQRLRACVSAVPEVARQKYMATVDRVALYKALAAAGGILLAEKALHSVLYVASYLVPMPLLDLVRQRLFSRQWTLLRGRPDDPQGDPLQLEADTEQLIVSKGYGYEEHYVDSPDGFVLALHRIAARSAAAAGSQAVPLRPLTEDSTGGGGVPHLVVPRSPRPQAQASPPQQAQQSTSRSTSRSSSPAPVVLILHGLMMASDAWVCRRDSLAFHMVDAGYDVWLADMRGNRYSCHHRFLSPESNAYWAFCLDDIARLDVPVLIDYILATTKQRALTFVGFSQGAALGLAAMSVNPNLQHKIAQCVAIAPATSATGFHNPLVDALVKASPEMLYFLFGRRKILGSADFWRHTLSPRLYRALLDSAMQFLFGWTMARLLPQEKDVIYAHLYNWTSVQAVVQYLQIMRARRFTMYQPFRVAIAKGRVPVFPLKQVTVPLLVVYSTNDRLLDSQYMLANLPPNAQLLAHHPYEHLDFLFAGDAKLAVYEPLLTALQVNEHLKLSGSHLPFAPSRG
jgi:lysosomal acid lipase/cholesteryl ester hydrolase